MSLQCFTYLLHLSLNTVSIVPLMSLLKLLTWHLILSFFFPTRIHDTTHHQLQSKPTLQTHVMLIQKCSRQFSFTPSKGRPNCFIFIKSKKRLYLSTIYLLKARDILFLRLILPLCLIPLPPSSQLISSCSFSNCLYSFLCRQSTLELQTKVPEDYAKFYNHDNHEEDPY